MFYIYILRSNRTGKLYTGFSANLKQRLNHHYKGDVHTTKRMNSVRLIYYEAFLSEKDARRREKYLKSTKGKRTLKLMLKYSLGAFV